MEKNESSGFLFFFNLFHSFITHITGMVKVFRGEGGAANAKRKAHEGSDFKHAPDLTLRP